MFFRGFVFFAPVSSLAILIGSAACGRVVEQQASAGGGLEAFATSTGSLAHTSNTAISSVSSGAGGSGPIGPLDCAPGDALIVGSSSATGSRMSVRRGATWSAVTSDGPAASLAAYVDPYNELSLFRISEGGVASFTRTSDGITWEPHPVTGWAPLGQVMAPTSFASGPSSALLGVTMQGPVLAYFDPDAFDWSTWKTVPPGFAAVSSIAMDPQGTFNVAGRGDQGQLCDSTMTPDYQLGPTHCWDGVDAPSGGEIPVTEPQLYTLANGDEAILFFSKAGAELSAAVRHAGSWSALSSIESNNIGISFSAAPTKDGGLAVATFSTSGELSVIRYSPGSGFDTPLVIDTDVGGRLAASSGICGDDIQIAFGAGGLDGRVDMARVRGAAWSIETVATYTHEVPQAVAMTIDRGAN